MTRSDSASPHAGRTKQGRVPTSLHLVTDAKLGPSPTSIEEEVSGGAQAIQERDWCSKPEAEIDVAAALQTADAFLRVVADITIAIARRKATAGRPLPAPNCVAMSPESEPQ